MCIRDRGGHDEKGAHVSYITDEPLFQVPHETCVRRERIQISDGDETELKLVSKELTREGHLAKSKKYDLDEKSGRDDIEYKVSQRNACGKPGKLEHGKQLSLI